MTEQKIKAIIVDDEASARDVLRMMIENFNCNCDIIGEANSVADAIKIIKDLEPDLLLLDIELPDGTGFEILEVLGPKLVPTIFVTAFDHYAIKAIKHNAFDYILKPVDQKELYSAIKNINLKTNREAFERSFQNYKHNQSVSTPEKQKIGVKYRGEQVFISLSDIIYCQADQSYTTIHLSNQKRLLSSKNLGEFEKLLSKNEDLTEFFFYRIHHSSLINTKYIDRYDTKTGILTLITQTQLKVSERRKAQFHKLLKVISNKM